MDHLRGHATSAWRCLVVSRDDAMATGAPVSIAETTVRTSSGTDEAMAVT